MQRKQGSLRSKELRNVAASAGLLWMFAVIWFLNHVDEEEV